MDFILWHGLFLPALFGLVLWYYRAYRRDIIGLSLSYLILVALINIYCVKFAVDPDSLNLFGVLFGLAIIDFILLIFILTKLNHWFKQQSLSLSVDVLSFCFVVIISLLLVACSGQYFYLEPFYVLPLSMLILSFICYRWQDCAFYLRVSPLLRRILRFYHMLIGGGVMRLSC